MYFSRFISYYVYFKYSSIYFLCIALCVFVCERATRWEKAHGFTLSLHPTGSGVTRPRAARWVALVSSSPCAVIGGHMA